MTLRKLEKSDFEAILALSNLRPRYMRLAKEDIQKIYEKSWPKEKVADSFDVQLATELKSHYLNRSFQYQMFGAFSDAGELTAVIGMNFSNSRPLWTLSRMMSDPRRSMRESGLGDLYEYCIAFAENLGVADYLTCIPERLARVYDRSWESIAPSRYRYEIFTEERVEAHGRPFYAHHFKTMGYAPWPQPILIRRHSLKENERALVIQNRSRLLQIFEEKYGLFAKNSLGKVNECTPNFA